MSSPQGEAATPLSQSSSWEGSYGIHGWRASIHAGLLLDDLRAPHGKVPVTDDGLLAWNDYDWMAFSTYQGFRHELDWIEPRDGMEAVSREVDLFHACLPFSEGERRWLLDFADSTKLAPARLEKLIVGVEATITSNGLHQVVKGRELVRRWAAWRRETDEFAGQGTVGEAQQHIRKISQLLQPEHDLTNS